jgi:hypothetical protein
MRAIFPYLLLLGLLPACGGDDGTTTDDASTGATSNDPTGGATEPTTGEPADLNERELGAGASQQCLDAMTHAAKLTQAVAAGDATAALAAYAGTDLQTYVVAIDGAEGTHDAAITASLALGDATELAAVEGRLHVALIQHLRAQLAAVEEGTEDHYATWDEAHCIFDGGLRGLATAADAVTWTTVDEQITADIDASFQAGHDGIQGEPPNSAIDDWQVPPNKQRLEKSLYRAIQRVIVELAVKARKDADPAAARHALELFASIESRLDGRNTPGIAQVQAILGGDPAAIDPDALLLELDIAFAKRTRTYASGAIDGDELGVPSGYEGAVEGATYAKLIAAGIIKSGKVANFDLTAYLAAWDRYAVLVRGGTQLEELNAISKYLVDTTCAYQTALGVAECSGNVDETK